MNGYQAVQNMYDGNPHRVPVCVNFTTEYLCKHSGIPDYRFLFGTHDHRAKAHTSIVQIHNIDGIHVWMRGKRRDWLADYELVEEGSRAYIWDNLEKRRLELSEDGYAIDFPEAPPLRKPLVEYGESQILVNQVPTYSKPKLTISAHEDVDRFLPLEESDSVKAGGMLDGVKTVIETVGDKVFLEVGCNSSFRFAVGWLGLQEGLIFMRESPEVFGYLVRRCLQQELEYYKACIDHGIHGGWITDIWVDLISEDDYRRFVMPCAQAFFECSREMRVRAHYWPTGQTEHLIDVINEMRPDAVHFEEYVESDIADIRQKLDPRILLYGNIQALETLQRGPISKIEEEVKRQIDACLPHGPFIVALGSEVTKATPPEHVDALIQAAHSYRI